MSTPDPIPVSQRIEHAFRLVMTAVDQVMPMPGSTPDPVDDAISADPAYDKIVRGFQGWKKLSFNKTNPDSHDLMSFRVKLHTLFSLIEDGVQIQQFASTSQLPPLLVEILQATNTNRVRLHERNPARAEKEVAEDTFMVELASQALGIGNETRALLSQLASS